jgi:hypothetical protein
MPSATALCISRKPPFQTPTAALASVLQTSAAALARPIRNGGCTESQWREARDAIPKAILEAEFVGNRQVLAMKREAWRAKRAAKRRPTSFGMNDSAGCQLARAAMRPEVPALLRYCEEGAC